MPNSNYNPDVGNHRFLLYSLWCQWTMYFHVNAKKIICTLYPLIFEKTLSLKAYCLYHVLKTAHQLRFKSRCCSSILDPVLSLDFQQLFDRQVAKTSLESNKFNLIIHYIIVLKIQYINRVIETESVQPTIKYFTSK